MIITKNSPVIFHRNVDDNGNPISIAIPNEPVTVFDNKGYLNQVPDKFYRVAIYDTVDGDMVEIDINDKIELESQYKASYGTERLIYFHPNKEGKVLNASYSGIGYIFIPSDNISSQTDASGNVIETLKDILNAGKMIWQTPVTNYATILTTYPNPEESWTVQTTSDNKVYRYNGTSWGWVQTINVGNAFIKTSDDSDDITQGTTNLFVTSTEKSTWNGKQDTITTSSFGTFINSATAKTAPVDADYIPLMDSAVTNIMKKLSWAYIKSVLNTYFLSNTQTLTNKTLTSPKINENVALTPTATELNYVDGVTSPIQTQIGTLTNLTTTEKGSLVGAINEADNLISTHKADLITDSDGVHGLKIEEGTWTPTIAGLTTAGSNTYSSNIGKYIKIGNQVTCWFSIVMTVKDVAMVGVVKISGLPFTTPADISAGVALSAYDYITLSSGYTQLLAQCNPTTSYMFLRRGGTAVVAAVLDSLDIANNTMIKGSVTYRV